MSVNLGFYQIIEHINPDAKNLAMTVIEGDHLGEKALISNEELVWVTKKGGFFSSNLDLVVNVSAKGVFLVAGEKVYIETLGNEKKMVICGAGHVSIPIIKIGLMVGFHITVIEDRPMFADNARRAGAQRVICDDFEHALAEVQGDADTFFVIVTRGHRYDQNCLGAIAMKPHAYMGMIGSRRRIAMVKELLINNGIPKERLNDLHAPIGLNIGAQTPEEIAVAIIAEVIEVKNKNGRSGNYKPEILKTILEGAKENPVEPKEGLAGSKEGLAGAKDGLAGAKDGLAGAKDGLAGAKRGSSSMRDSLAGMKDGSASAKETSEDRGSLSAGSAEKKILATIITRTGSAPRGVGTKMLVKEDGTCLGTVGGGCAEARVIRRALNMLRTGISMPEVFHVDLAADTAEEEGMVCGGQVDVLLEVI